ncbi:MAG: hypothetical protein NC307_01115 [Roseburia sp.]|nr:hypothetical protein [Roseburia sp.]
MRKMKQTLTIAILIIAMIGTVLIYPQNAHAGMISPEEVEYTPTVFTTITTQTDKVRVYVYEDTTLKVKSELGMVFKKTYKSEGKKTITIPEQKAGTKLRFTLTTSYGKTGSTVTKRVKDDGIISNKKINSALKKPKISGKITDKSTTVKIYARKGDTLYIQNGASVLIKHKYRKTGYQVLNIKKQKADTKLTFYVADKKGRSGYVTKVVQDVTAPAKPKIIMEPNDDSITVKGEAGTDVYVKQVSTHEKNSWVKMGTMREKEETFSLFFSGISSAYAGDYYSIRLVDDAGNKSEVVNSGKVTEDIAWEIMY